uniref:Uncharacterized protein n=1 Tax=Rhizophagus irregularis (strain DAOM 181602 / DAOM 197198 / MUCL 43194) TaxID=747089 RepID=U9TT11_RHIID
MTQNADQKFQTRSYLITFNCYFFAPSCLHDYKDLKMVKFSKRIRLSFNFRRTNLKKVNDFIKSYCSSVISDLEIMVKVYEYTFMFNENKLRKRNLLQNYLKP